MFEFTATAAGSPVMALAGLIIATTGLSFCLFASLAFIARDHAQRFLHSFAQSAVTHYLELAARLVAGASFILLSTSMHFAEIFRFFGWLIVITSIGLLFVPWRWHRRFAEHVIPVVIRYLPLYAIANLGLGAFVLYGLSGWIIRYA